MARRELDPLGPPPALLDGRTLSLVRSSAALVRIFTDGKDPKFFGKTGDNRFDAKSGEFGVMYAAADPYGAFIEVFGEVANWTVTLASLDTRGLADVQLSRELTFLDLTGEGLAQIGADSRLFAGEQSVAQLWSVALWKHPSTIDGLCYRARHDPSRLSFAIYDRASDAVTAVSRGRLTAARHRTLLGDILDKYQFRLIDA
jgi:hypothetical protein